MTPVPFHHQLWHQQAYWYNTKMNYPSRRKLSPSLRNDLPGEREMAVFHPVTSFLLFFVVSYFHLSLSLSLALVLSVPVYFSLASASGRQIEIGRGYTQSRFRCFLHWTYRGDTKRRSNTGVRRIDGEDVSKVVAKRIGTVSSPSLTSASLLWQYKAELSF